MRSRDTRRQTSDRRLAVADPPDHWQTALMVCTALVLGVVLIKCVVRIWPDLYWDWDPRSPQGEGPNAALGPAGLAWLNVLSLLLAGISIGVHVLCGGAVRWCSSILVFVGSAFCAMHMLANASDARLGGAWVAAMALGLAALHLAIHERPRRLIVAALAALLVPLVISAIWYVVEEHPRTVADFVDNEAQILRAKGFMPGSPQHKLFVQRMNVTDAIGAVALSNVFGSMLAALTLIAGSAAAGALSRRMADGFVMVGVAAAGLVAVLLTHSKGAAASLVVVAAFTLATVLMRHRAVVHRAVAPLAIALVVAAVVAVLARGWLGPPQTEDGERSLLFRYHYWQAAARMVAARGAGSALTGVGIAGFGESYPLYKNPVNPEQVSSAHNVVVDNVTMFGLGGVAISAVLFTWLWSAGRRAAGVAASGPHHESAVNAHGQIELADILWALLVAVVVFTAQFAIQSVEWRHEGRLVWLAGAAGFVFVASLMLGRSWRDAPATRVGLFAGALFLLFHNQIDMTFYSEGGSSLAWLLVGAAAAPPESKRTKAAPMHLAVPAVWVAASLAMVVFVAMPVTKQQQYLAKAADRLAGYAGENRPSDPAGAVVGLEAAITALPNDRRPYRSLAAVLFGEGRVDDVPPLLERATRAGAGGAWVLRLRLEVARHKIKSDGPSAAPPWTRQTMRDLLAIRPFGLAEHLRVANLAWDLGQRDQAMDLYRRCLELDQKLYLDPARQLSDTQRRMIEQRLAVEQNITAEDVE